MLADAKAQHLEVKQIFREWKPLGASVVASWRITAAPLLRLRKVPLRAYADVERIFAFERKIKPMLKTLKTEVRAAKAAKDAAAREMDDFDRSVRRRVARDVLGIFPGQLFLHVCGGCIFSSLVVWYCVRKREKGNRRLPFFLRQRYLTWVNFHRRRSRSTGRSPCASRSWRPSASSFEAEH